LGKNITDNDIIRQVAKLALGRTNDIARLAFLEKGEEELIGRLNLSLLSEIKRGSNGTVEVKLLNRLEILRLLAELIQEKPREGGAAGFYAAINKAAEKLGEAEAGVQ